MLSMTLLGLFHPLSDIMSVTFFATIRSSFGKPITYLSGFRTIQGRIFLTDSEQRDMNRSAGHERSEV